MPAPSYLWELSPGRPPCRSLRKFLASQPFALHRTHRSHPRSRPTTMAHGKPRAITGNLGSRSATLRRRALPQPAMTLVFLSQSWKEALPSTRISPALPERETHIATPKSGAYPDRLRDLLPTLRSSSPLFRTPFIAPWPSSSTAPLMYSPKPLRRMDTLRATSGFLGNMLLMLRNLRNLLLTRKRKKISIVKVSRDCSF